MRRESRSVVRQRFAAGASLSVLCLALSMGSSAEAARQGHGRIVSAPGKPLQVTIPMLDLTDADIAVLKANVAPAANWTQSGLNPPVPVESLRVAIQPGSSATTRMLVVSSDQPVDQPVVDILLDVATATGAGQVQVSFLVPARAAAGAGAGGDRITVARGDTLFGIAQRHAVPGASVYQMLWALYQANPQAFMQDNMNLLRAGAQLSIPDAETVRAIDPKHAQQMFLQHQQALGKGRGAVAAAGSAPARVTPGSSQSGSVTAAKPAVPANTGNQVRLTASSPEDQKQDAKVAATKELAEIQSRVDALQQNVKQLKEALGNPADGASGAAGAQGAAGATGATGATGAAGAAGGTGATGAAGGAGAAGAAGVAGAGAAASAKSAPGASATSAGSAAAGATTSTFERVKAFLAENVLMVITAILAASAFVIAWILRRAGTRRDDENDADDIDAAGEANPVASAAFEQKMQSIDLNLDDKPIAAKPGEQAPKA